jgi:hypothetical protein
VQRLTSPFRRLTNPPSIAFSVEASPDLSAWHPGTFIEQSVDLEANGTEIVVLRDTVPVTNARFLRLGVTQP